MSGDGAVLVTGAAGYIATHVVQQLLEKGYRVRGTVRSLENENKTKPLRELCPGAKYQLELFEADLTKEDGWAEAVRGCQYVIHTASPLPAENPEHEDEVIRPAVDGTLNVLKACRSVGGVQRVVLTSSMAAVCNQAVDGNFSEKDWTDVNKTQMPYYKSKTLAERAAWDFVADLPEGEKFELAVINPAYVIGPVLCGGDPTSLLIPRRLLQKEMPMIPRMNFACVDVMDTATAHINAMTTPEAAGNRHILATGNMWMKEIAVIYDKEFGPLGYKIPKIEAPQFMMKMVAVFDKTVKMIMPLMGKVITCDNTRMRTILNIEPRDLKDSFIDMAYSMIERGFVKKTNKYIQVKEASK